MSMKDKNKRYRIVRESTLSLDGVMHVLYYPEYKGWFGWRRFAEYNIDNCTVEARFDDYGGAKAFLNNVVRMNGLHQVSVVGEFVCSKD